MSSSNKDQISIKKKDVHFSTTCVRQNARKRCDSWSTMIGGLANHGRAPAPIRLIREMQKTSVEPNEIMFVGLLSACSHAGFLEDIIEYFNSMRCDYDLELRIEHYGCLVDLGRTGCLDRALEFINTMPVKLDSAIWGSLLNSCRTKGNLQMAVVKIIVNRKY